MLKSRWFIALLLITVLTTIFIYDLHRVWMLLTLVLVTIASYEWGKLCKLSRRDSFVYSVLFVILSCISTLLLLEEDYFQQRLAALIVLLWVFVVPWWLLRKWHLPPVVMMSVGMLFLFTAWMASSFLFASNLFLLTMAIAIVCLNDSIAYFVGRSIGQTPLAVTISPKKTVEGSLGGIGFVMLLGMILYWYIDFDNQPLVVVLAIIFSMSVLAVLGDLSESQFKRYSGVKDSGVLLGDHGGVLDRFDAMLPVLPFIFLLNVWTI